MIQYNLTGYLIFALITSITPGPNNFMLFVHGKAYGLKNSIPIMLGIFLGFSAMLYITGYGMASFLSLNSGLGLVLKIIASGWLLYLAYILSKISSVIDTNGNVNIGFVQAFFMQFVNPKAWIMAINSAVAFLPKFENIHLNVFVFTVIFGLIGIPCMVTWVLVGDYISKMLKSEWSNKILGYTLFLLMIISIITIWL
jgi:threonine/homoserine/homoserine lactone efflux protein